MPKISDGQLALGLSAAFAIWLFGILPFLYGPPPRFAESGHKQQSRTAEAAKQPDTEPRGTAREPFFVQVIPSNKTAHEADEERRERDQKASNEWLLMAWTGLLALFTAALVLVAGVQAAFFFIQLGYMREEMNNAKSVAEAARESAVAATRSADVVYNQLKIALDSAIKAERGLLVTDDWQIIGFGPRERPVISCILRNTGRSPNYITQGVYDYSVANELPTAFDIFEQPILPLPGIIRQTTSSVIVINDLPELSETEYYDRLAEGGVSLYLRIRLRYRDVTGGRYEIITTARYGITAGRDGERLFGFEFPEEQRPEEDWPRDAGEFADSRQYNNHRRIDTGGQANPRADYSG